MTSRKRSGVRETGPVFVERLGVGALARFALFRLFRVTRSEVPRELFVIEEVSRCARVLAWLLGVFGIRIKMYELKFDFVDDVWLPDGSRAIEEVYFKATASLLKLMGSDQEYISSVRLGARKAAHGRYIHTFLSKRAFLELYPGLRSIHVAAWYSRSRLDAKYAQSVLYLPRSWLFNLLSEYGVRWNVKLRPLPAGALWGDLVRRVRRLLKWVYVWVRSFHAGNTQLDGSPPRIAVEMYLNGIRRDPIYNTEFFWYRQSSLPPGAVFGYFAHPHDQPTESRQARLREAGIGWVDRAALRQLMYAPLGRDGHVPVSPVRRVGAPDETTTTKALRDHIEDFYSQYERWRRFFTATGTRIHVSMFDIFPESEALHAALADIGGVSISVQRSIERDPYVLRRTVTDVHFAFCRAQAKRELASGSSVRQFITAGYPFDYAFPAARAHAGQIVSKLRSQGVEFIVCFLDENDGIQTKRYGGRRLIQGDYDFLFDRLAADGTLGLVLKPKRPETLPERLGPVWSRLEQFIESGRCVLLAGRPPDERYLPCVGAGAANLTINLLYASTPGLESYLTGTRALLVRHGVHRGAFERLPAGSVVFDTWEELWEAVERFRANPADPHIGNWEPIIEEFASLRDGRASERIQSYITWLYEAFASDKSREEAMEYAGGRYAATWGRDLITEISQPFLYHSAMADTRSEVEVDSPRAR